MAPAVSARRLGGLDEARARRTGPLRLLTEQYARAPGACVDIEV